MTDNAIELTEEARRSLMKHRNLREAGIFATPVLEVFEHIPDGCVWIRCPFKGAGFLKLEPDEYQPTERTP